MVFSVCLSSWPEGKQREEKEAWLKIRGITVGLGQQKF